MAFRNELVGSGRESSERGMTGRPLEIAGSGLGDWERYYFRAGNDRNFAF